MTPPGADGAVGTLSFPPRNGMPGQEERLLILREVLSGEVKYFLSNRIGSDFSLGAPPVVAFSRWHVECLFEDGEGQVGFDHFEVRCYRSLMRHLALTTLSLDFLCEQVQLLGGESREGPPLPPEDMAQWS